MRKAFGQRPVEYGIIMMLALACIGIAAVAVYLNFQSPGIQLFAANPFVGLVSAIFGFCGLVFVFADMERWQRQRSGEPTGFNELSSVRCLVSFLVTISCAVIATFFFKQGEGALDLILAVAFAGSTCVTGVITLYYLFDWVASQRNNL